MVGKIPQQQSTISKRKRQLIEGKTAQLQLVGELKSSVYRALHKRCVANSNSWTAVASVALSYANNVLMQVALGGLALVCRYQLSHFNISQFRTVCAIVAECPKLGPKHTHTHTTTSLISISHNTSTNTLFLHLQSNLYHRNAILWINVKRVRHKAARSSPSITIY